jgi:uncharacterized protein (DUF2461 family)
VQNFIPGNTGCVATINLIQAAIELLPLGIGQRDQFRRMPKTFPELLDQLQALGWLQFRNVDAGTTHGPEYSASLANLAGPKVGISP